jgi:hypothetical protein
MSYRHPVLEAIMLTYVCVMSSFGTIKGGSTLVVSEKTYICFQKDDLSSDNIVFIV